MEIQTPHDKALQKAKIELMTMKNSVFFSDLLLSFKIVWDDTIRTACVGGTTIRINTKFFMGLPPAQRVGVLLHEVMHPAYMHPMRLGSRDPVRFNIAGDHVINLDLLARGYSLPSFVLADAAYLGMTTEQVYDLLPQQPPPDFIPDVEYDEDQETENQIEDILVRASIRSAQEEDAPGTIPGDIQVFIDNLLKPKVRWQNILAKYKTKFAKNEYSFTKPRRRYMPMVLPSMKGHTLIDLAIGMDLSGSVSDAECKQLVVEMAGIFKTYMPEKITLIQFDTQIRSVDTVGSFTDLMNLKFTGRGGTNINPVLNWAVENKPQLLLIFTDGEFKKPKIEYKKDLLWIIHNNPRFTCPFGKVTHYSI